MRELSEEGSQCGAIISWGCSLDASLVLLSGPLLEDSLLKSVVHHSQPEFRVVDP